MLTVEELIQNKDFQELYKGLTETFHKREAVAASVYVYDTIYYETVNFDSMEAFAKDLIHLYGEEADIKVINQTVFACNILTLIIKAMLNIKVIANGLTITPGLVRAGNNSGVYKLIIDSDPLAQINCIYTGGSNFYISLKINDHNSKYLESMTMEIDPVTMGKQQAIARTININTLDLNFIIKAIEDYLK